MPGSLSIVNVLLVAGGGFQGVALLKGLLRAGNIRVVLADCYEENIGRYFTHRSYAVPPIARQGEFIKALLEICESEKIQFVFPCTERELPVLAKHESEFAARGVKLAMSGAKLLERICDKKQLCSFLQSEGLPAPKIIDVASPALKFPILGKPANGWGGRGQIVLHSADELKRHSLKELRETHLWQPFLEEFTEYSVDFAINFSGQVSEICIRERVRASGGFAVIATERHPDRVAKIAEQFVRSIARHGGLGIFNLQIISAGSECFISDVNPRMGTSAVFGYGLGVNLPVFVCSPAAKVEAAGTHSSRRPLTMVRHLEELFVRNEGLDGIRGVIFDLDDTLLDQKRWILSKLRKVHRDFESRLPEAKAFLAKAMAILEEGNRSGLIDALRDGFGLGAELGRELIEAYRNVSKPEARVFDDVRPLLDELKRRGYRLGILTNNPPRSQRQKIAACGFQDRFDEIVYAQELGAEKPARDGFVEIARRLKLAPEQLVMAGDHLYSDIGGALGSGYAHGFFIQRPGGFFNFDVGIFAEVCGGGEKFTVITSLREMLPHLGATR